MSIIEQALPQAVIALAGGGVGVAIVNVFAGRRKNAAEVEALEVETASKVIKAVTDELARLQAKVNQLEMRLELNDEKASRREEALEGRLSTLRIAYQTTRDRVDYLTRMVRQAGLDVTHWTPPSGLDLDGE